MTVFRFLLALGSRGNGKNFGIKNNIFLKTWHLEREKIKFYFSENYPFIIKILDKENKF